MDKQTPSVGKSTSSAHLRIMLSILAGVLGSLAVGGLTSWKYAPLAGWDIAAIIFLVWIWLALKGFSQQETARLAVAEYPGRAEFDIVLVLASVASIGAVGALLLQGSHDAGTAKIIEAALGIASVVISWAIIHTVYALKYARIFYINKSGIDFNTKELPGYSDFIYMAFTIGMTFQVADTNLQTSELRKIVLRHALLSYLFGTVILASAINLIIGLGK